MNKKERMAEAIKKHGEDLNRIFKTDLDPVTLCKKLRRLELQANELTTDEANTGADHSAKLDIILYKVRNLLYTDGPGKEYNTALYDSIFINGDPRGYALKIDDQYVRDANLTIYRDWGGYGILAPDLSA